MVVCALAHFAAGLVMYAVLFAAIGSAVEQESDAQYLMLPAMFCHLRRTSRLSAIQNPKAKWP